MDQYRNWRFSLFLSPSFIFCLAWGVRRENGEERDASLPPSPVHRFIHEGVSYFLFLSFRFRSARSLAISRIQLGKFALPAIVYFLSILFSICPRFFFLIRVVFLCSTLLVPPQPPPLAWVFVFGKVCLLVDLMIIFTFDLWPCMCERVCVCVYVCVWWMGEEQRFESHQKD